mmetsp:Transcript_43977/g.138809  ORF Transcript_43977/g.138809 Transcript_43977/m.138809 type:complete len:381 (+) Transcript_43977:191-1333(+)
MKREYLDPDTITPRLPLPYRMIDNLIRSLVEEALEQTRDDKEQEKAIDSVSAVFEYHQRKDIILSQASSDGLLVFVCTSSGSLECINSLRGAQVGEPIVLGEPATCLTLSSDGRALAVGLRSKVNILQVMKDSPFLKHLLSIETRGVPKNLAFSSDSTVFVVISEAEELELFRIALPEVPVVEEEEEAKNTSSEASGEKKEEAEGEELVPTMKDPVRVLRLKCSREKCKKMFFSRAGAKDQKSRRANRKRVSSPQHRQRRHQHPREVRHSVEGVGGRRGQRGEGVGGRVYYLAKPCDDRRHGRHDGHADHRDEEREQHHLEQPAELPPRHLEEAQGRRHLLRLHRVLVGQGGSPCDHMQRGQLHLHPQPRRREHTPRLPG